MSIRPLVAILLVASLTGSLRGQYAVGVRDVAWANTTGQGTSTLTARVHYPATTSGTNVPVLPRAGGWPVVVFLHGFATPGTWYGALGDAWAERGFAVVVSTTTTFDNVGQEHDGRALYHAVGAANGSGTFAGAFDVGHQALAGHSMGGGNVGNVLADNPGYRCGFAIAPVDPRPGNAAAVEAPLGIIAGQGDSIAPWQTYALPYFQGLGNVEGLRSLHLLDGSANHTGMAGLFGSGGFAPVVEVGAAFFEHWLGLSQIALERVIGPAARSEPSLVSLDLVVTVPQTWLASPLAIGATSRLSIASEPGLAGVVFGTPLVSPVTTPAGLLHLDPATAFVAVIGMATSDKRLDASLAIPNAPTLAGLILPLQAFGIVAGGGLRFGLVIEPVVN